MAKSYSRWRPGHKQNAFGNWAPAVYNLSSHVCDASGSAIFEETTDPGEIITTITVF